MVLLRAPIETGWTPPDAIAYVSGDPKHRGPVSRFLRRAVGEVALSESLDGIGDVADFALVVVDYDALGPAEQREIVDGFSRNAARPTLLLLSERNAQRDFARLFGSRILTNMLVLNGAGPDVSDLLVTVQKIRQGNIFGLEKYFVWGVEPRTIWVSSSSDKLRAIYSISEYIASIGVAPRLRSQIRTVADEFLSNALYNAPTYPDGSPRYASRPRTQPVSLDEGEQIEVRFCCDGRRFGMSTADPFGSLAPARLQDYLARAFRGGPDQIDETEGGAGLGFYQIIESLSHFVVNIDPGERTEMIGLIDVSGSYRKFATSGKSFNIFVKEAGA